MAAPEWAKRAFSNQTDEAVKAAIVRAEAIREIENTRGFKLIRAVPEKELEWAKEELSHADALEIADLQAYVKTLKLLLNFLSSAKKYGEAAAEVLADRPKEMDITAYHDLVFQGQK